ncbi:MAG: hypothetical protein ACLRZ2_01350 [Veillonella sp.]
MVNTTTHKTLRGPSWC